MRTFYGNESDTIKVFDAILQGLVEEYWKTPEFRNLGIGLEGSIEAVEELIDKGFLRITYNESNDSFFLRCYNLSTGEYEKL